MSQIAQQSHGVQQNHLVQQNSGLPHTNTKTNTLASGMLAVGVPLACTAPDTQRPETQRPEAHRPERRVRDVGSPTGVERRSLLSDNVHINVAIRLIRLGARLQMLEAETKLPYERLLKLYKEVAGKSPPKGQLPFSTDWFMAWQPNIHASLFYNYYEYLQKASDIDSLEAIIKAYEMYERELALAGVASAMSITRAWRLVKFVDCGMLSTTQCTRCKGHFINHSYELSKTYVCGLCAPPARAGKAKGKDAIH